MQSERRLGRFESDRQGNNGSFPGKGIEKGNCKEKAKHGKQRIRQLWGKFGQEIGYRLDAWGR